MEERINELGSALRFARESKKGPRSTPRFIKEVGYSPTAIYDVESGSNRPSQQLIEKYIKILDPFPCQRKSCEGRVNCNNCTIATIVQGLEFKDSHRKRRLEKQTGEMVFDMNITDLTDLMNKLGLSVDQQEEAKRRILTSSLEICLEIAKEPQPEQS